MELKERTGDKRNNNNEKYLLGINYSLMYLISWIFSHFYRKSFLYLRVHTIFVALFFLRIFFAPFYYSFLFLVSLWCLLERNVHSCFKKVLIFDVRSFFSTSECSKKTIENFACHVFILVCCYCFLNWLFVRKNAAFFFFFSLQWNSLLLYVFFTERKATAKQSCLHQHTHTKKKKSRATITLKLYRGSDISLLCLHIFKQLNNAKQSSNFS